MNKNDSFKAIIFILIGFALLVYFPFIFDWIDIGEPTGRVYVPSGRLEHSRDGAFYTMCLGSIFGVGFIFNGVFLISDPFRNWLKGDPWLVRGIRFVLKPFGWVLSKLGLVVLQVGKLLYRFILSPIIWVISGVSKPFHKFIWKPIIRAMNFVADNPVILIIGIILLPFLVICGVVGYAFYIATFPPG